MINFNNVKRILQYAFDSLNALYLKKKRSTMKFPASFLKPPHEYNQNIIINVDGIPVLRRRNQDFDYSFYSIQIFYSLLMKHCNLYT